MPQVVQACHVCRPWEEQGQSNKVTYSFAMPFNEEAQFDLMFHRSALEFGLGGVQGIPTVHPTDCACGGQHA